MRMVSSAPQKPSSPLVRSTPQSRGHKVQCLSIKYHILESYHSIKCWEKTVECDKLYIISEIDCIRTGVLG